MERRTLSEIYDALAQEKADLSALNDYYTDNADPGSTLDDHQTFLQDLSSESKVAIWRLIMWVVAVGMWIHEGLWFAFRAEVDEALLKQVAHTTRWYAEESLKFQYGDALIWSNALRSYVYETYDPAKCIVKRAAAMEGANGIVALKVATESAGVLGPLSTPQKTAFAAFWAKYKDAGVILNIISEGADLVMLAYTVYYDPLVLNTDGTLITDGSTKPVEDAINNYIAGLDFNGRLRLEGCDAAVKSATGVIDFKRTAAQARQGSNNWEVIDVSRIAYAGYYIVDPDQPLADTLTYEANV